MHVACMNTFISVLIISVLHNNLHQINTTCYTLLATCFGRPLRPSSGRSHTMYAIHARTVWDPICLQTVLLKLLLKLLTDLR
jgi:hypothetical protein